MIRLFSVFHFVYDGASFLFFGPAAASGKNRKREREREAIELAKSAAPRDREGVRAASKAREKGSNKQKK